MKPIHRILCCQLLFLALAGSIASSPGSVMIAGGGPDSVVIAIADPIVLTANVAPTNLDTVLLRFQDVFATDHYFRYESPLGTPSDISIQINGGAPIFAAGLLAGVSPTLSLGPRDLFIAFVLGPTTISSGDIFTISKGGLMSAPTAFRLVDNVGATVAIEMFDNDDGESLTLPSILATPEPSRALLSLLGLCGVLLRRRR